jgi:hypothetical protein
MRTLALIIAETLAFVAGLGGLLVLVILAGAFLNVL